MRRTLAAALLLCAALLPAKSLAETRTYVSEYAISVLGLPVGASRFETVIGADRYQLTGTLRARGLVALFQPTRGSVSVTGSITGNGIEAADFSLSYVSGDDRQLTEIGFANGGVASTANEPEVRKREDWIAVTAGQLKGAIDPISAMLIRAGSFADVCGRTVRIYDGAMRMDVKLAFVRVIPFSTDGFRGDAVTCRATFEPVSGYNKGRKEIAWLRDNGRMDVSFADMAGNGIYAPVKATVATQIGPARIFATRFEASAR